MARVREAFTPELTRERWARSQHRDRHRQGDGPPVSWIEELVKFPGDLLGMAFNVDEGEIGVVLLGEYWHLSAGDEVERTGRVMDVVVATDCWGASSTRWVDQSMAADRCPRACGCLSSGPRRTLWMFAGNRPLQTGLKVIDALIPWAAGHAS